MPLVVYRCIGCGHTTERYVHRRDWALDVIACSECDDPAQLDRIASMGSTPLNFFSESSARVIQTLQSGPLTSYKQHRELMKARGVEPVMDWHVSTKPSKM